MPVGDDTGVIELTITGIERGAPADLRASGYQGSPAMPYFVRMRVKVVSGLPPGVLQDDYIAAWAGDDLVPHLVRVGSASACETKFFSGRALPGRTLATCATYVVDEGAPGVDRITYYNTQKNSRTVYDYGTDTAVTWE